MKNKKKYKKKKIKVLYEFLLEKKTKRSIASPHFYWLFALPA